MNSWRQISKVAPRLSCRALDSGGIAGVENPEIFLRLDVHVPHADHAAHERRPGLFRDRLQLSKIPELLLPHLNLGDVVVDHTRPQHTEAALFEVAEHSFR